MEQRTSARLAGKAAAVAVSPERAAATVKRESISSFSSSSNKRQRSVSPSTDAATNSHNDDETNSNNDDAADAATDEMPWGSSWWDKLPAEIRIMIINHNSPLHNFLNGRIGTKKQLEKDAKEARATAVAIWVDAFKSDWKGNLDLLPTVKLSVKDGLCEAHTRSMYERLRRRFPGCQRLFLDRPREPSRLNDYTYRGHSIFDEHSLLHIPARHGWFDLLDFEHPTTLGWFAIMHGHLALLRHLAFTLKVVDLSRFERFGWQQAMDHAAGSGCLETLQMLHDAGNSKCTAKAMDQAAAGCHLDVMQWLHANRHEGCTESASQFAAAKGYLHVVEWLTEHYPSKVDKNAVFSAGFAGHVDVLAFLLSQFPDFDVQAAMNRAAYAGRLEVVKWFHTHRPDAYTPSVLTEAVERDHADIVQFLLDSGHSFDAAQFQKAKTLLFKAMMVNSLTLERAQALLEDVKASDHKPTIKLLDAAIKRLEKAKAKADKAANPKKRKISSE